MLMRLWDRLHTTRRRTPRDRRPRGQVSLLGVEALEERCLMSADAVIQWNQAVLQAIRVDKPTIGFVTRDLAIVQTAIYDAVNAIDHTSSVFKVQADAPIEPSPVAAADAAGGFPGAGSLP